MNTLMTLPIDLIDRLNEEEMLLLNGGAFMELVAANNAGGLCSGPNNGDGRCTGGPNNGNGRCDAQESIE